MSKCASIAAYREALYQGCMEEGGEEYCSFLHLERFTSRRFASCCVCSAFFFFDEQLEHARELMLGSQINPWTKLCFDNSV